jgi:hypothetical protein
VSVSSYFAAYPIIDDICTLRYAGRSLIKYSTRQRDAFQYANCAQDETLIYRIHRWRRSNNQESLILEVTTLWWPTPALPKNALRISSRRFGPSIEKQL